MLNTKKRIIFGAYSVFILNFTTLIFLGFGLLESISIIELFVSFATLLAGTLVIDLYKYNKEQRPS